MIKNNILIYLLIILALFSCNSNNRTLYKIQENGMFGFIDSTGKKIIEPQYLYVSNFNEGVALAVVDTIFETTTLIDTLFVRFGLEPSIDTSKIKKLIFKYGFINTKNKFILPPVYTYSANLNDLNLSYMDFRDLMFYDGLSLLQDKDSKKYGFITKQGDTLVKCEYNEASHFSEGMAAVQKEYKGELKWGYIDKTGKVVIDFQYRKAYPFFYGIARTYIVTVNIAENASEISGEITKDKGGNLVIEKYDKSKVQSKGETWSFTWLLIDNKGHIIKAIDAAMNSVYDFTSDSVAKMGPTRFSEMLNIGYSFINRKGEKIIPLGNLNELQLDSIVKTDTYVGYINDDITILDATKFSNGYAGVKLNDKTWYFIDKNLIVKSPKKFQHIYPFSNGLAAVKDNNKWGFVNNSLKLIIPCLYDSCETFRGNLAKVYTFNDGLKIESYLNTKGEVVWQKMENTNIIGFYNTYDNKYSNKKRSEYGKWRADLIFSGKQESFNNYWIILSSMSIIILFTAISISTKRKKTRTHLTNLIDTLNVEILKYGFNENITKLITEIDHIKNDRKVNYDWALFELLRLKTEERKIVMMKEIEDKVIILEYLLKDENINAVTDLVKELKSYSSNPLYKLYEERINDAILKISKVDELKKIEIFKKRIINYKSEIEKREIDVANLIEKEIAAEINDPIYISLKPKFDQIKNEFEHDKRNGILVNEEEVYVQYNTPPEFEYDDNWEYAVAKFPAKGTIVWPYRRGIIARRGFKEEYFENELIKWFSDQLNIYGDVNLLPQDGCRPYEPDIAIIDKSNYNIRVDIEIDEPYAGISKVPTHYIGCGDNLRDININRLGWIVVRFAERQIHLETDECIAYIANVIKSINPDFKIPIFSRNISMPTQIKQWSQLDAQNMVKDKVRENYLKINEFRKTGINNYKDSDLTLTEFERNLMCKVERGPVISGVCNENESHKGYNSKNKHKYDSTILFYPDKHLYTYNGFKLDSVGDIISPFFPLFDVEKWSEKKPF